MWPGMSTLVFGPGRALATAERVPGTPWPKPWGRLTTPGQISSLTSTTART